MPVLIWLAVIFTESMSPFAASDETSRIVIPVLHWLMPRLDLAQLTELHHMIRKIGHFTGYGLLGYLFFRAWRGTYHVHAGTAAVLSRAYSRSGAAMIFSEYWRASWALLALFGTSLVATCDEVHQMTLANRTGSWWDVLLDSIGGLIFQIAVLLFWKWRLRARRDVAVRVEA